MDRKKVDDKLTGAAIPDFVFPRPSPSFHPILDNNLWPLFDAEIGLVEKREKKQKHSFHFLCTPY